MKNKRYYESEYESDYESYYGRNQSRPTKTAAWCLIGLVLGMLAALAWQIIQDL